jgi:hypothetical protein
MHGGGGGGVRLNFLDCSDPNGEYYPPISRAAVTVVVEVVEVMVAEVVECV